MSNAIANIAELLQLAAERSSDRRRELLRRLTDAFIEQPEAFDSRQTAQISDILSALAREMDVEVRRSLARRIADFPEAPRGLLVELANDEITVARPILTDSLVLTDTDLMALAKMVSQEHLEAIARRGRLSAPVTDELTVRGNDAVLLELAGNSGAELSRGSLEILISRAEQVTALHEPLVARDGVPFDLLSGLFFVVSTSLRRAIVGRAEDLDPAIIEAAIRESERRVRARGAQDADDAGMPAATGPVTEAQLCKDARAKNLDAASLTLARLSALGLPAARKILTDHDPVGLAVVCRACRFERDTFAALMLSGDNVRRTPGEIAELIALYDRIPVNAAQRVLRFWRIRRSGFSRAV
jgi:uncharacterized protein (DUF2336 family)